MSIEILMFTGPSCSACELMKPHVKEIDSIRIVDVTEDFAEAQKYRIRGGLPVFVKLINGEFIDRISGAMSMGNLKSWIGPA